MICTICRVTELGSTESKRTGVCAFCAFIERVDEYKVKIGNNALSQLSSAKSVDEDKWKQWDGTTRQKPDELFGRKFEAKRRDGRVINQYVAIRWFHTGDGNDIVAYRIITDEQKSTDPKLNPKHGQGVRKFRMSGVPACVLGEIGVAMTEGVYEYGAFNYRSAKIEASTYYDATMRHLMSWWEGEDIDAKSGLSHVTKAIASLVVLRDSMINGTIADNRPPKAPSTWVAGLNAATEVLTEKYEKKT